MSTEFDVIEQIFDRQSSRGAGVVLGIGDDAALTRFPEGCELVTATDALVLGTHFLPAAPARAIGHRSLAINLSDLAAMGAEPMWASLAIAMPTVNIGWLQEFADGFFDLADSCGVELIGGDTVRGQLFAAVTVQGYVPRGQGITRSGAQVGDLIYVTGAPGEAAAGRSLAAGELSASPDFGSNVDALIARFNFPTPRLQIGAELRDIASAMIDVSDGLHPDLQRMLAASKVGAALDVERIPSSPYAAAILSQDDTLQLALCGGEDYELCFTVPVARLERLEQVASSWDTPISCLGEVIPEHGLHWLRDGNRYSFADTSFEHFS